MKGYSSYEEYLENPLGVAMIERAKQGRVRKWAAMVFCLMVFVAIALFIPQQYDWSKYSVTEIWFICGISALISEWFARALFNVLKPESIMVNIYHYEIDIRKEVRRGEVLASEVNSGHPSVVKFLDTIRDQGRPLLKFELKMVEAVSHTRPKAAK